ncbi:unnamed protein product [Penicillium nalgiovense]|nr:unnamed protein product [Penicillium nalgiovense]
MSFLDNSWIVVKRQNVHVRDKKAAENVKFTGHGIKELEYRWVVAVNTFFAHGGGAEQKFGSIATAELTVWNTTSMNNNPVHRSCFNPQDERLVLTFIVTAVSGEKRKCHVFETGKGTRCVGDIEQ